MAERKRKRAVRRVKKDTSAKARKTRRKDPKGRTEVAKGVSLKRGKAEKLSKKPGSSSVGEYKEVSKGKFCGASGGASKYSYPVNSKKRCHAALAYARNAPNPSGIRSCVKSKCKGAFKKPIKAKRGSK